MGETCERCGRDVWPDGDLRPYGYERCWHRGGHECEGFAAGYRRGIAEGVRLAKERATIHREYEHIDDWIDWTDVDAAAEKAKGGA